MTKICYSSYSNYFKTARLIKMRKERRSRKRIKADLMRSYYTMESKVDPRAKEVFKRKPYAAVH